MENFPHTASEGTLTGVCSEAFRNTNDINSERVRKGLEARSERLRSKRTEYSMSIVRIFYCSWPETAGF